MEQKTLHLVLKKKWFSLIESGEKLEEYREIKPYWASRLIELKQFSQPMEWQCFDEMCCNLINPYKRYNGPVNLLDFFDSRFKSFDLVRFRNGYRSDSPEIEMLCTGITVAKGKEEWGAEPGKYYFVISLGNIPFE